LRCRQDDGRKGPPTLDTHPEDDEIVARVRGGDRDAYAELVTRHASVAIRTAALLGAGDDAEDVVQEAFVKAYATLDRFRAGASFRPWLLRIVANEARNAHRTAGRRVTRERRAWELSQPLLLARPDDPGEVLVSADRQAALVRGLDRLTPVQRQVVTCRYLLDLDEAETVAVLGWPRGTVKSRLRRALARLRDVMGAESGQAETREVTHGG
jgi:RNA polymerase sigma-70 factor (ECF subfamily)